MKKHFFWMMAAIFLCGTAMLTSCSDDDNNSNNNGGEKMPKNLTMEVLTGLWVVDYAESGSQGDQKWTRTVEAYQFNADSTTYHESYQLNGEKYVTTKATRDDGNFHFVPTDNTITITGDDEKTVTFTYADGKLTTPEGKVLQKATEEQQKLVEQLYADYQGGNASVGSNDVGYVECSWNGTEVVKTNKVAKAGNLNELTIPEGRGMDIWGTWYVTGYLNFGGGIRVKDGKELNIILCDGAELKLNHIVVEGKKVEYTSNGEEWISSTLRIFAQEKGTGKLTITDPAGTYAAIGGHNPLEFNAGVIEIHGGNLKLQGASGCSAIGAGYDPNANVNMTNYIRQTGGHFHAINIYDGNIEATGGGSAAGIGVSNAGGTSAYGTINIYGGNITAQGGGYNAGAVDYGGAGIGGSNLRCVQTVNIYGGNIKAIGGSDAAGIGAGEDANNYGNVNIYGGTVIAQGGSCAAGIGGGDGKRLDSINISGGMVYAYAGKNGAGIGGGEGGQSGDITITGGTVRAYGDRTYTGGSNGGFGAGIGSGQAASVNNITITGGDVEAYGGDDAAGIGTGEEYGSDINSGNIIISGGKVYAKGGGYGAGIGAGEDATCGLISIANCRVDAHAGKDCGNWSGGIGAYHSSHSDGCHIGWAGWERIYIGAGMRLYTYSDGNGYIENVNTSGDQWWNFVHQRPQVAFGVCDHEGWEVCPLCYSYTIQLK